MVFILKRNNGFTNVDKETSGKIETYVLNTSSHKIHKSDCESVIDIAEHNKKEYEGYLEDIIQQNYKPCHRCFADYYGE